MIEREIVIERGLRKRWRGILRLRGREIEVEIAIERLRLGD